MALTKWTHVYDDDNDGKYVGFFMSQALAEAWIKTHNKGKKKKRKLRISDTRPTTSAEEAS